MGKLLLIRTVLRSFLIQGSMNFERMHNLGIAYILLPALKWIYRKDEERLKKVLKSHIDFYNCHPYMSSFVLGTVIKLEEKLEKGEIPNPKVISSVKTGMMGPLAAMGDLFFWRTLRPMAAVIAVAFAVNGYNIAPLVFLIIYNIPHLYIRIGGVFWGYAEDIKIINKVQAINMDKIIGILGAIGIFFSGLLFISIVKWDFVTIPYFWYFFILALSFYLLRKGFNVLRIFVLFLVLSFISQLIKGIIGV